MAGLPHICSTPDAVEAAAEVFASEQNAVYLAGGTDLIPHINRGLNPCRRLIDLDLIAALKDVASTEAGLYIGSMTILSDLGGHPLVTAQYNPLAEAARRVASPQIRNLATIGGNVLQARRCLYLNQSAFWRANVAPCHQLGGNACYQVPGAGTCRAAYYSDLAPVLLAYGAGIRFFEAGAFREQALEECITAQGERVKRGRLVCGFLMPPVVAGGFGTFLKYSPRGSIDFALANAALVYAPARNAADRPALRIFAGAVAPAPVRLVQTEARILDSLSARPEQEAEIIHCACGELESLAVLVREAGIPMKAKKKSLLIMADILADFFAWRRNGKAVPGAR